MLTLFIFNQYYAYLIIAVKYEAFHNFQIYLINKLSDLNYFSYWMAKGNIFSFSYWSRDGFPFFAILRYYYSIKEKIVVLLLQDTTVLLKKI